MSTSTSSEMTPAGGPAAPTDDGLPHSGSDESQKWFASAARFQAAHPTGAFDNVLASFRLSPRPTRLRDALLTVGVLYGGFVGVPALAGLWAAWRIWREVNGRG